MKYLLITFYLFLNSISCLLAQESCKLIFANNRVINKIGSKSFVQVYNSKESLIVNITNSQNDTIYIFSSYLNQKYINSKYLHRLNKKRKEINLSLIPITPLVYGFSRNKYLLDNDEKIITEGQIMPEFLILYPKQTHVFTFEYFRTHEYIKEINAERLNLFEKIKFRKRKLCQKKTYSEKIQLAIYHDIKGLCGIELFRNNPAVYYKKVKEFEVLEIDINDNGSE